MLVRHVRLATGLVLFAYVTTHLLNHACGLLGLAAMEAGRKLFIAAWRSPVGAAALYASLATHLALALWSLFQRRQLRIPLWEGAQLMLGLAIPTLLITHAIGTHLASGLYGVIDSYTRMMLVFWARPEMGIRQVLLLIVAWTHGCIGLHFWLRLKPWYGRLSPVLAALALLVPLLALLGFLEAMREITELARSAAWLKETLGAVNELGAAQRTELARISDGALLAFGGAVAVTLVARRLRNFHERRYKSIRVTYPDGRRITAPIGYSVLEISRHAAIPHASVCGGRGRCSTCRVRVSGGLRALPAAHSDESVVLQRIGAPPDVRLACQLRPASDLSVTPLLPPDATALDALALPGDVTGEEREVCVLFADLRGFTRFSEHKLPYDIVFFLNRYFETMSGAIEDAGGVANQFTGDGVMALFGVQAGAAQGCRDALHAARIMVQRLAAMSLEFAEELDEPMRMGIGIHAGPAVVGRMGRGSAKYLTAVGDTVNVASRLQELTKEYRCSLIVSESAARQAGLDVSRFARHEVMVRDRSDALAIRVIDALETLA
ncbi:MAG TPA: adenylate/guanylate cyclase domain-containing protein [Burkholderiales bacterium]|nr:adenylate/guanylate cyclase domain-containing protein [Burkholderiales bacterium]